MGTELAGRVALVTGAGRGIGRAIAAAMAREGAHAIALDLKEADLAETVATIRGAGGRADSRVLDITDSAAVRRTVDALAAAYGGIDTVVNNAAWLRYQPLADIDEATLDRMFAVAVKGPVFMAQAAVPHMLRRGGGTIVNLSSSAAIRATPASASYCAVKAAVAGLTRQLAVDLGPHNIRVNAIAPGFIETPAAVAKVGAEGIARRLAITPLGRLGAAEDIAELATFLASGRSAYVTGEVILADGGRANAAL
ncbi:SDR family NAD(P)-dependent oxidoreductase [Acuticoccus mangrovi]|uniref:SDR family oxidoreductase n=1 Tax=Acuticoccus mangrovi TaxID=2796142 RepID=A0A934INA3_9HYPH|nr:SDR family oxidoreductase [Acuticoccus mangrovi]MBJ3775342.1 SDR family oxidoreductase [Acuticoccus mangrovi]